MRHGGRDDFLHRKPVLARDRVHADQPPLAAEAAIAPRARAAEAGFTLVEIMMVVLIISFLGMLAVPAVARIQRRAKSTAIVNDFRVFAAAFDAYAQEHGSWPAEAAAGVVPAGMSAYLNTTAWTRVTPMGGKYNWENNQLHFGTRYRAAIAISAAAGAPLVLDAPQLLDLEKAIDDDGNLLAGNFHLGTGLIPLFIVQP